MNSLLKKFIQFSIGNGLVLIIGFITSPIITRMISPNEMGKFSMFNTFSNLLVLLALIGIDQSYVRYYYDVQEENRGNLLKTCIKISLICNLILAFLILIFYKKISLFIIGKQSFLLVIFLILNITSSVISRFSLLQIRMKQRAKLYSIFNVALKLVYLILVLFFFNIYKNSYITLLLAIIISNGVMGIWGLLLERKEIFNNNIKEKLNITTKEMIKYGIPFIFSMAITWLFQSIDRVAIKEFCGYMEVGLYSGAMNIIVLLNACQGAFTTFWVPVAYEHYSKYPNNKEFFAKINQMVSASMLIIAILLIAFKDLIVLLLGPKYREAVFIFPYLVFMPIMYTISETTVMGINFKKKTKNHIYIAIISAVSNVVGNLILVPKYGAKGAAISTGLAYIVFFIVRTYLSRRYYKINFKLGRFFVCTILTYILAMYSSFYSFNYKILVLVILSLFSVFILYKDMFKESYKFIKIKFKRKNK